MEGRYGMLTIYQWQNGSLREVLEAHGPCWINLADPSTEEISRVQELTSIPREYITDPLDKDERPRLEIDDDGLLLFILHVPYHEPAEDAIPFNIIPLGVIHTPTAIVTICNRSTPVTSSFLDQIRRVCTPEDQFRFTFHLLWHAAILYLRYLRDIRQRADMVEQELHEAIANRDLMRLFNIEKSLVYFTTSLKANDILLSRLEHTRQVDIPDKDLDALEDVQVEFRQALEMATIHSNILSGTLDTYASIISNNLNNVMKFLTCVTIIFMIPTLVTSAFGMNIHLPLSMSNPYGFLIISAICLVLSILAIIYFIRRRLL